MKKQNNIEQKIRATMEHFDSAEDLPPDPHFYARVQARIDQANDRRQVSFGYLKPALLAGLALVNLATAVWFYSGDSSTTQSDSSGELVDILTNEFNLAGAQRSFLDSQ